MNRFLIFLIFCAGILPVQALEVRRKSDSKLKPPLTQAAQSGELKLPEDARPFVEAPDGLGISIEGHETPVAPFTFLTVTFPKDMVAAQLIDTEGAESPVVVWPAMDTSFTWRTPTSGELILKGPVIPGQTYRLRLKPGLAAADQSPFAVDEWGVAMTSPPLRAEDQGYGERTSLNARPQARVDFNYPVDLATAAQGAWFQDRLTRERFPAEVLLNSPEGAAEPQIVNSTEATLPDKVYGVRFRPIAPLPVGRFYDLVIDEIQDAYAGRTLPYPEVIPMGTTRPLDVDFVSARNFPLEKPQIVVKFSRSLEEGQLPAEPLKISPPVGNLKIHKDGAFLIAEGDFKIPSKYTVTISDEIVASSGYGLAKPELWGATFRTQGPAVIFPDRLIRQRGASGLRFAFYQVNTGALTWKAATIPADQLTTVEKRVMEFAKVPKDSDGYELFDDRGIYLQSPTEPLIEALNLPVLGSGEFPSSSEDIQQLRELNWKPDSGTLEGPVLVEVTGQDSEGRLVGNRAIVLFGDLAITRKESTGSTTFRVAGLTDGMPVAGADVTLLNKDSLPVTHGRTDAYGQISFPADIMKPVTTVQARAGEKSTFQPLELADRFPGAYLNSRTDPPFRAYTFTDRPLYRPMQTVHFKGFVREVKNGANIPPAPGTVSWQITQPYGREVFASGTSKLDENGGWHGTWTPPDGSRLGEFVVSGTLAGLALGEAARFQIEEFRNPPFSVVCEEVEAKTPGESAISVQSQYFHGAPNAGARVLWKAVWFGDSEDGYYTDEDDTGMTRVDLHSENAPKPSLMAEVSGEATLDLHGKAIIRCQAPFADSGNRARSQVFWKVDVTGPDGQTITGGETVSVPMAEVLLGIKALDPVDGKIPFEWDALLPFEGTPPKNARVSLFKVTTKSVKERLASNVYRYRNFDFFEAAEKMDLKEPGAFEFATKGPGRYVAVLSPVEGQSGMPVSAEIFVAGEGESEIPVEGDSSARILQLGGGSTADDRAWNVGDTAVLTSLTPTEGIAWVSIETDHILETFTMPLTGNTARIEIPVKPEYEPNVYVAVYVLRPGGESGLAGEMYGSTNLRVQSPSRRLDVSVAMNQIEVEPRTPISGTVSVKAGGQPVAGADLAIYGVDDSILELGGWSLPSGIESKFFPLREHAVLTFSALKAYVDGVPNSWLRSKGFVVGGGGEDEFGNVAFTRKEFKPLILWIPSVKTNKDGLATFTCEAPDNLTRFRFIAVGQTRENQFGAGDAPVVVSKKLTVEPALPRFVREGDDLVLRAVVRQKAVDSGMVKVRCSAVGQIELLDPLNQAPVEKSAAKNAPVVVTFRAKAKSVGAATVKFEVAMAGLSPDSVEVSVPVEEPVVLVKEAVGGALPGKSLDLEKLAPAAWKNARGTFDASVSTSPWLPKLLGIPYLLEYPHGCFEQKSSRLLLYTNLARLLEYLPNPEGREESYRAVIESTLREFENSLLPDGTLPYWPGGSTGNTYVTLQSAWCVLNAEEAGLEVPERLAEALPISLTRVMEARSQGTTPSLQTFAFFMLAKSGTLEESAAQGAAAGLYAIRDRLTAEAKALLAIGMSEMDILPEERKQLVRELPKAFSDVSFNPATFSSATRTEAMCLWARLAVEPEEEPEVLTKRLMDLMESSQSLSTQENLWLLVAFNSLMESQPAGVLRASSLRPKPDAISKNTTAAAWIHRDLSKLAGFAIAGLPSTPGGSYVLSAAYRGNDFLTPLVAKGLRIERVIKNLTDLSRDGSETSPLKLGDELLISYRFSSDKPQSFVALEDAIPAGLEVINPNLALISAVVDIPQDANYASLSHSEMRDRQTNLYFDDLGSGTSSYAVMARATTAGRFIWPATQLVPMYDSRFFARSPSSVLRVSE